MKGKVYCLKDPITDKVRYVGFTRSNLKTRFSQHKHEALKRNKVSHVYNWFRGLDKKGVLPYIYLLEDNINVKNWEERENFWINSFSNLTNQRGGGCGVHHNTFSIESSNHKKKPVIQVDTNGNFIKEWPSSVDAETAFNGKHTGNIFSSIKNGSKAFGFFWYKKEHYVPKKVPERKLEQKVFLYCVYTNKLVASFGSLTALANIIKCAPSTLVQANKKNLILQDHYYIRYDLSDVRTPPEHKQVFTNAGKYYTNFNQLYKDGDFKLGLGALKKKKDLFKVKNITEEIVEYFQKKLSLH